MSDQTKRQRGVIMQTELERLQNEMVAPEAPQPKKKAEKTARARLLANARAASGPYAGTNWRRYGG